MTLMLMLFILVSDVGEQIRYRSVTYITLGTPHSYHKDNALAAIAANKHVLCEKPMTVNAAETEVVIAAAKEKGVFLMEGKITFNCV